MALFPFDYIIIEAAFPKCFADNTARYWSLLKTLRLVRRCHCSASRYSHHVVSRRHLSLSVEYQRCLEIVVSLIVNGLHAAAYVPCPDFLQGFGVQSLRWAVGQHARPQCHGECRAMLLPWHADVVMRGQNLAAEVLLNRGMAFVTAK
jgi:hypothetical protein